MSEQHFHFKHFQDSGAVHVGEEVYPIVAGVVACPLAVGRGADWTLASPEEIEAYENGSDSDVESVLDGTVADVEAHVLTLDDAPTLEALAVEEAAGKKRKGVLEAIAARLAELAK